MLATKRRAAKYLMVMCVATVWAPWRLSADDYLEREVRALFTAGDWEYALRLLKQVPNIESDPAKRELLAMAYLYTANRLDSASNLDQAKALSQQIVDSGGKAHFFVALGRGNTNEIHMVDATPGELIVTKDGVEFQPEPGALPDAPRWDKKEITQCLPNEKHGKSSNSFHLTVGGNTVNFRPLHFSIDEVNAICPLIVTTQVAQPAQVDGQKPSKEKKKKEENGAK